MELIPHGQSEGEPWTMGWRCIRNGLDTESLKGQILSQLITDANARWILPPHGSVEELTGRSGGPTPDGESLVWSLLAALADEVDTDGFLQALRASETEGALPVLRKGPKKEYLKGKGWREAEIRASLGALAHLGPLDGWVLRPAGYVFVSTEEDGHDPHYRTRPRDIQVVRRWGGNFALPSDLDPKRRTLSYYRPFIPRRATHVAGSHTVALAAVAAGVYATADPIVAAAHDGSLPTVRFHGSGVTVCARSQVAFIDGLHLTSEGDLHCPVEAPYLTDSRTIRAGLTEELLERWDAEYEGVPYLRSLILIPEGPHRAKRWFGKDSVALGERMYMALQASLERGRSDVLEEDLRLSRTAVGGDHRGSFVNFQILHFRRNLLDLIEQEAPSARP